MEKFDQLSNKNGNRPLLSSFVNHNPGRTSRLTGRGSCVQAWERPIPEYP